MKTLVGACLLTAVSSPVFAGSFEIPSEKPAFTIAVPDKWRPNHSEDGIDAVSPDSSAFLSVAALKTDDRVAARDDALAFLSRNGMVIDRASATESAQKLAGSTATQTIYSAKEDGKAKQVVIIISPAAGKRSLQVAEWGTPDGLKRNAAPLTKILASIKPLKKTAAPAASR